ncbi:MAG: ABC transporter permease [Merdimonas faecis]|uniref:ABC transporter permease n=1 Tax=Merdimonas faecis TaxID=1653435 RepID=UPI0039908586
MKKTSRIKQFLLANNTYIIFLALFIICCLLSDKFFSYINLRNILLQQVSPILVALGMLMVILTGGIDLSVGSVMALGSSLTAVLATQMGIDWRVAILIALAAGIVMGAFTGFLVAYCNFQGFVASLAVMTIARGLAYTITNATPVNLERNTLNTLTSKDLGYPVIIITLLVFIAFVIVEKYTVYGRIVIAVGSNSEAVKLSGIRVKRYLLSVYVISGFLSMLAGIFIAARSNVGNSTIGEGQELDAIAACVIGGASLAGGKGSVTKTVIGALTLALIGNIMNLLSVPAYPQEIIMGFIIIVAVFLQVFTDRGKE